MAILDMYMNPQIYCQQARAQKCLSTSMVRDLSTCYGAPPTGVHPWIHAAACMALSDCGALTKVGCPTDEVAMFGQIPTCINTGTNAVRKYCLANPTFRGADGNWNKYCFKMARYPAYRTRWLQRALCPGASGVGASESTSRSIFGVGQDAPPDEVVVPGQATAPADATKKNLLAAAAIGAVGIGFVALMMKKKKRGPR